MKDSIEKEEVLSASCDTKPGFQSKSQEYRMAFLWKPVGRAYLRRRKEKPEYEVFFVPVWKWENKIPRYAERCGAKFRFKRGDRNLNFKTLVIRRKIILEMKK